MQVVVILAILMAALIFLTGYLKLSPFLGLLLVAIAAGLMLQMPIATIAQSVSKGIGDMLGSVLITLCAGAMMGKLVAESGAASVIAQKIMAICGKRYLLWGLALTGLIIGIPLFYNVGFVLVVPIIFAIVQQYKLPIAYVAIPILASLSAAHSLLPPHPSPATLVGTFKADMGLTFLYGLLIAIPAIMVAGPIFAKRLQKINPQQVAALSTPVLNSANPPSFTNSILSSLLPVLLLSVVTLLKYLLQNYTGIMQVLAFISDPSILMLIALLAISCTLGIAQNTSVQKLMQVYETGVKDIAMILLIIGASGALKQILIDSQLSHTIGQAMQRMHLHPLVLGWGTAAIIRMLLGSATVAGLTAAGIMAPLLVQLPCNPNLMVLAIGAGSIFCSHVNDTGFWMFKEYFSLSLKQTFLSWTLMEIIVSVIGLLGILLLNLFV
jgi:Gnt-I system high-affinity gluconate transporter